MAAVSLPSGPVTALHPETELVAGWCHGAWRIWGMGKRESVGCDRIIEERGNIESNLILKLISLVIS